jgi:hypothetical protein
MFKHQIKISTPTQNRWLPNVGDSGPVRAKFQELLFGAFAEGGVHRWYYEEEVDRWADYIHCLLFYDDSVPKEQMSWSPTQFMPEGDIAAVFRSDWSTTATYMLLVPEHLPHCSGHNQPDNTSFLVYAENAYLLVDSGDGRAYGWGAPDDPHTRTWTYFKGHNLVMIDNEPPYRRNTYQAVGDKAHLTHYLDTGFLDFAQVDMHYGVQDVDTTRSILFPDHSYFVVHDNLRADTVHNYDFQLHFGGQRDEGVLDISGNDVTWRMKNIGGEDVEMRSFFASPRLLAITEHLGGTAYVKDMFDHTFVKARVSGEDVHYLAVLYPRKLSQPPVTIQMVSEGRIRGARLVLGSKEQLVLLGGGLGAAVGSEGELVFLSAEDGELAYFALKDGRRLQHKGTVYFSSNADLLAALEFGATAISGSVEGAGEYEISIRTSQEPLLATFEGEAVSWSYDSRSGMTALGLQGKGALQIVLGSPLVGGQVYLPVAWQHAGRGSPHSLSPLTRRSRHRELPCHAL